MTTIKKKSVQKKEKKIEKEKGKITDKEKKDLSKYTIPTSEALTPTQEINNDQLFSSLTSSASKESRNFWESRRGKMWIGVFALCITGALLSSYLLLKDGIRKKTLMRCLRFQ